MLHILSSSLHSEELRLPFEISEFWLQHHQAVAVLTGGTEGQFVELVHQDKLKLYEPIYLIVSQQSNSLAAAMEILAWLNSQGGVGKIVSKRVQSQTVLSYAEREESRPEVKIVTSAPEDAVTDRIGVIGQPSDWLIASWYDRDMLRDRLDIEVVDIPIEEVTSLGKVDAGMKGAEAIYERLKEIIVKCHLTAITLRCFDLLKTVENTGCIALSRLNDEGIPASCEGDVPTLVTMILSKRLTGCPGFQANPARIDPETGKMLFAHCTIPLSMTETHSLATHFESGIGVAIHGELPEGDYTLVKVSGDLSRVFAENVQLVSNQYEPNLCRTQVWLQASPEAAQMMLTNPIGNHHVIVPGHHAEKFITH